MLAGGAGCTPLPERDARRFKSLYSAAQSSVGQGIENR